MTKVEIIEEISTEVDSVIYTGKRKVIGTKSLHQIIAFRDRCIKDVHGYKPSEINTAMLTVARQILTELVTGRALAAESAAKHGL